jgi:hypothetical protein
VLSTAEQQIALVSVDVCLVYQNVLNAYVNHNLVQQVRDRVLALTGIRNVVVVATHTHSSFDWVPYAQLGADGYSTFAKLISDAVVLSVGLSDAAEVGVNRSNAQIGFNRSPRTITADGKTLSSTMMTGVGQPYTRDQWVSSHPIDPVDDEVILLHFRRTGNNPRNLHIATLLSYACHGVILGPGNFQISADWPGATMLALEEQFGVSKDETAPYVSLFLQGCAGNIDPWFALTTDFSQVDGAGRQIAAGVTSAVSEIGQFYCDIPLGFKSQKIAIEPAVNSDVALGPAEVNTITFGRQLSAAIVTFPAEMFVELGLDVKRRASELGISFNLVCGYSNDALGYVPSEAVYDTHGYETDGRIAGSAELTWVLGAKSTGEQLVSAAVSVLQSQ